MRRLPPALVVLILVACSRQAPSPDLTPATNASQPASASPVGNPAASAADPAAEPTSTAEPQPLSLELVASGVGMPSTITIARDGTFYINETTSGLVRVIDQDGTLRQEPFLDVSDRIR